MESVSRLLGSLVGLVTSQYRTCMYSYFVNLMLVTAVARNRSQLYGKGMNAMNELGYGTGNRRAENRES
jgi:hypothetical protein